MLKLYIRSFFSPHLYRKHRDGPSSDIYKPRNLEYWGDLVIRTVNILTSISLYASPFIAFYAYRKGFYTIEKAQALISLITGVGWLTVISILIRAVGRVTNPQYVEFLKEFYNGDYDPASYLQSMRKYDYDFYYWPVSYSVPQINRSTWLLTNPFRQSAHPELPAYKRIPLQLLAFVSVHTFGLRIIYPGTLFFIFHYLWRYLTTGRAELVETHGGLRAKLVTADGNSLDTMFVDKRLNSNRGKTLVICSEGNSGYYEIGIMFTPIRTGYSVLGWNHPGFAESTGIPFPSQEENAIDVVMQYAINKLGFRVEDIVLFGWSIGGYTATFGAVTYPEVKALLLDATFDDILPIAKNQMPKSLSILVEEIIRSYTNLNLIEMLPRYRGPTCVVRRNNDEVISLRHGMVSTNRGNDLVKNLIETRHPTLTQEELALVDTYVGYVGSHRAILSTNASNVGETDLKVLKLISKYLQDFNGTHCVPLPDKQFVKIMNAFMRG